MTSPDAVRAEHASLRAAMSAFRHPSFAASLWQLADTFVPLLAIFALMYWSVDALPYWVTLLCAIPAAGLVVRVFIIQHDCGHGAFFRSRWANTALGRVCGLLTCTPYEAWRRQHAGHHAGWNDLDRRDLGVDIYSTCLTMAEYRRLSPWRRRLFAISRHPVVAQLLLPPLVFLVLYRLPFDMPRNWRIERRAVQFTNLGLLAIVVALGSAFGYRAVALVHLPVMVLAAIVGVWLFSVQHRFPGVLWERHADWNFVRASLEGSSMLRLPRPLQWFTGNIGFHHVHHLDPRIPNYRLEGCHASHPAFRRAKILSLRDGLGATRHVLWDEDRGEMVRLPRGARGPQSGAAATGS
ncbi:fatty acid desaturase [Stella sp.]|uniref:fatty acid desaturase family protein n=1 Tax=Stella sp. TaxID=2912054 RepID=UPI0035B291A1